MPVFDPMMIPIRRAVLRLFTSLAALAPLAGCQAEQDAAPLRTVELASPAGAGSAQPNLSVRDGRVYLSWLEPAGEERHALRFSVWEGDGWSAARTIAEGAGFFVNWADFPSLVELSDGRLAAHWLVRSGPGRFSYDVHIAQSPDGGRSWSPGLVPHRDGTETEHGFVSLFDAGEGLLGAVWLDGRHFAGEEGHAEPGEGAEMTLRHTRISAAGVAEPESVLDDRVCECCQTAATLTADGPLVVYRDRSADEVRDIAVVRRIDGRWTAPRALHRDGWQIAGCPVNGPAAAADGDHVAVAWFTGVADTARVRIVFSDDAGASFGSPVRVDDGDPLGRVGVVLLGDGDALVSWLERTEDAAEIRIRRISPAGERGTARRVAGTAAARASGFPRLVRSDDRLVFAWTEVGEPTRVRTAVAELW